MPSASPRRQAARLAALAVCGTLLAGATSGCQTTQETAAAKRERSKQILENREKRRAEEKADRKKEGKQ